MVRLLERRFDIGKTTVGVSPSAGPAGRLGKPTAGSAALVVSNRFIEIGVVASERNPRTLLYSDARGTYFVVMATIL